MYQNQQIPQIKALPLFEEFVDFDTFSKSDFRAVKVKECVAVPDVYKRQILKNAEVVVEDEVDLNKINVGCAVKVYDITFDEEMEFKIVGSTEANSLEGKISNESPVGHALIGKKINDVVDVETQAGVCLLYTSTSGRMEAVAVICPFSSSSISSRLTRSNVRIWMLSSSPMDSTLADIPTG